MTVAEVVASVRDRGDEAVAQWAQRFGDPAPRRVWTDEVDASLLRVDGQVRIALAEAAKRIETFARAQRSMLSDTTIETEWGRIGSRFFPIVNVGVYVPSGRYPLPSTLLMCAIPARVAGVSRAIVCTPRVSDVLLAAAAICGVDEVYEIGGAQAIAAMAYGTDMIRGVDLIVGPGNAYVSAAKREVFGNVGIDALAGPSEICIIASGDADARLIAADLLAQAEHDPDARAMLLCDDASLIEQVRAEVDAQLQNLPTQPIARASLEAKRWWRFATLDEAVEVANAAAPEHLELQGAAAEALAPQLRNYGTLFIGKFAAEVLSDYGIGPNHVLPTNGSARFSSGLSVMTFLTSRTFVHAKRALPHDLVEQTTTLANAEGLSAHAASANARLLGSAPGA